jgi:uncharacterized protein
MIRILSSHSYEYTQDIESIRSLLIWMRSTPGHQFWEDSISIAEVNRITMLQNSKATTDLYLLALAVKNKGQLVTLDSKIDVSGVNGAKNSYLLLK